MIYKCDNCGITLGITIENYDGAWELTECPICNTEIPENERVIINGSV